jgi:hypothetical protein
LKYETLDIVLAISGSYHHRFDLRTSALICGENFCLQLTLMLQRKLNQRMTAVNTNFCADIISMVFNCANTDAEFVGNLFAREVFRDERQYSTFSWSQ